MSEDKDYHSLKNDGENWDDYKFSIMSYAGKHRLQKILNGTSLLPVCPSETGLNALEIIDLKASHADNVEQWESKSCKLAYQIQNTQSAKTRPIIRTADPTDGRAMWLLLLAEYEGSTNIAIEQLTDKFILMECEDKNMNKFYSDVSLKKEELKAAILARGLDIFDVIGISVLLRGCPEEISIDARIMRKDQTLTFVRCGEGLKEAMIQSSYENSRIGGQRKISNTKVSSVPISVAVSQEKKFCPVPGCPTPKSHWDPNKCWFKNPHLRPAHIRSRNDARAVETTLDGGGSPMNAWSVKTANVVREESSLNNLPPDQLEFTLDTGCQTVIVNSPRLISNLDASKTITLTVADQREMQSDGMGCIPGKCDAVHVVNSFGSNLWGMVPLADKNCSLHIYPGKEGVVGYIADETGRSVNDTTYQHQPKKLVNIYRRGNDYVFRVKTDVQLPAVPPLSYAQVVTHRRSRDGELLPIAAPTEEEVQEFRKVLTPVYERTGTTGSRLYELIVNGHFSNLSVPAGFNLRRACQYFEPLDDSQLAKRNNRPHLSIGPRASTHEFGEWAFDTTGPFPNRSWAGNTYIHVLLNVHSNFKVTFASRHKSHALHHLMTFEGQYLRSQDRRIIKLTLKNGTFKADNGGECKSKQASKWFTKIGCTPQYTNAHSSSSNPAERAIQTLHKASDAIAVTGGFPMAGSRDECYKTAAYVSNLLPCSSNPMNASPMATLFPGMKVDFNHLRVPGERCWVGIPLTEQDKEGMRAINGRFIGYAEQTNGYRIVTDLTHGGIKETSDVSFCKDRVNPPIQEINATKPREYSVPVVTPSLSPIVITQDESPIEDDSFEQATDHLVIPSSQADHLDSDYIEQYALQAPTPVSSRTRSGLKTFGNNTVNTAYHTPVLHKHQLYKANRVTITHKQAIKNPKIVAAMQKEIDYLSDGKVEACELPAGRTALRSMWVNKEKDDGRIKSRVCPFGCHQKANEDYDPKEVSAPTLSIEGAFFFLCIVVYLSMRSILVDVDSAFCQTTLREEVYMDYPSGWLKPFINAVLRVRCGLYGLKQAAFLWHEAADNFLVDDGFEELLMFPCLYFKRVQGELVLVALFVDDFRFACRNQSILDDHCARLHNRWKCKNPLPTLWLGMNVHHDLVNGSLAVSQAPFIEQVLKDFSMWDCKPVKLPGKQGSVVVSITEGEVSVSMEEFNFQRLIGDLLWIARISHPEILYYVNRLGRQAKNPTQEHIQEGKLILRYLKGVINEPLMLYKSEQSLQLKCYCDSDFGTEPESNPLPKRSISACYIFFEGIGKLYAQSSLQKVISRSTATAETRAVVDASVRIDGYRHALGQLGLGEPGPTTIYEDNEACIARPLSVLSGCKFRHEVMDHHVVREQVLGGCISMKHCDSENMVADVLTKALGHILFKKFSDFMRDGRAKPF